MLVGDGERPPRLASTPPPRYRERFLRVSELSAPVDDDQESQPKGLLSLYYADRLDALVRSERRRDLVRVTSYSVSVLAFVASIGSLSSARLVAGAICAAVAVLFWLIARR